MDAEYWFMTFSPNGTLMSSEKSAQDSAQMQIFTFNSNPGK